MRPKHFPMSIASKQKKMGVDKRHSAFHESTSCYTSNKDDQKRFASVSGYSLFAAALSQLSVGVSVSLTSVN